MSPDNPSFSEYQQALERLRRRAHARRAVMTRGFAASVEMPILDDQELLDRELCQRWQERYGFSSDGF